MGRWTVFLAGLLSVIAGRAAQAELSISVGTLNLQPGKMGYVDVLVSGDDDPVDAFGFDFRIQPLGQTGSWLQFENPQPIDYLTDASYLLAGDSFDTGDPPVGNVGGVIVPNDTFEGGDFSLSGANAAVTSSRLLARLEVTANTLLPPSKGDTFSILMLSANGNSYFSNAAGDPIAFTSSAGTVTIVPEPGTLCLLAAGALGLWTWRRFRGKRAIWAGVA